jgi:hypothetical protein
MYGHEIVLALHTVKIDDVRVLPRVCPLDRALPHKTTRTAHTIMGNPKSEIRILHTQGVQKVFYSNIVIASLERYLEQLPHIAGPSNRRHTRGTQQPFLP